MLQAKNIHKIYNDGTKEIPVLKGVDLSIKKGEFVAITGPSGAGKSTLLHILGGLDVPSKGSVVFEGDDLNSLNESDICKIRNLKIGFVFQFYHLLSEFNVLENVQMPAWITTKNKAKRSDLRAKAVGLLAQMGLDQRLRHFPSQLSGGEKQRVAIARALINGPDILFCDEPTGNLDSKTGEEIINLIKRISTQSKMSVVLITHNIELTKLADSVYHLRDGVLVN
ncbi:MAG: ABC transporter ATP-binding protein [Candidatus Omnitrophota bacterium]